MMLRRLLLVFTLLLGGPALAEQPGRLLHYEAVRSAGLEPRNVTIWLPDGYDESGESYPVLYMHDGQNLFEDATANYKKEWGVDEALTELVRKGEARPAIVVGIWSTKQRLRDYMPAKVAAALPQPYRAALLKRQGGTPLSDAYLRFLVNELKPWVDRSFRTQRGRDDTFIAGSSMGGLISLYAVTEYPDVFGAAAAVSTHWPLFVSWPVEPRPEAERETASATLEQWLRTSLPSPAGHRLYFDYGTETLDRLYEPYQKRMDRILAARGYDEGNWVTRAFPGAAHDEPSWRARVAIPLRFLLASDMKKEQK